MISGGSAAGSTRRAFSSIRICARCSSSCGSEAISLAVDGDPVSKGVIVKHRSVAHIVSNLFLVEQPMGTKISFPRFDGKPTAGYLAKSGKANAPGVVVVQEWWGLQDQIRGICDRLALAGYEALAPDLYAGTTVPYHDAEAAAREMNSLNFLDATDQAVRGAVCYLGKTGVKVGITGFCMGGAVAILGAVRIPEVAAAVVFYGLPPEGAFKPADIKVPLQAHYATLDDYITPEKVDAFEANLKAAKRPAEFFRYNADHGFMNEQRDVHERAAAELGWERMLGFWKKHL
jgi:carboxymethylenebutenolidase